REARSDDDRVGVVTHPTNFPYALVTSQPAGPLPYSLRRRTPGARCRGGPPAWMGRMTPEDEILDIVDENDRVVGQAPRGEVYAKGLRHRASFVLVRDEADRIFVHRRTATKLVYPSLYDVFVGGVLGTGETYDEAALREAEEELGVSGLPRPVPLFSFL